MVRNALIWFNPFPKKKLQTQIRSLYLYDIRQFTTWSGQSTAGQKCSSNNSRIDESRPSLSRILPMLRFRWTRVLLFIFNWINTKLSKIKPDYQASNIENQWCTSHSSWALWFLFASIISDQRFISLSQQCTDTRCRTEGSNLREWFSNERIFSERERHYCYYDGVLSSVQYISPLGILVTCCHCSVQYSDLLDSKNNKWRPIVRTQKLRTSRIFRK